MKKTLNLFAICVGITLTTPALAHDADCPYCKLKIVQNTKTQDNEVVLKVGNKRIEYRCIYCVIRDQKRYKGDLVVYVPSEKVGAPVVLKRTAGKWSAPDGTVFLNSFKEHKDCAALSRGFSSAKALEAYVLTLGVHNAKPLSLTELLTEIAKPTE